MKDVSIQHSIKNQQEECKDEENDLLDTQLEEFVEIIIAKLLKELE